MTSKTRFRVSALTTPGKTTNSMALSTIVRLDFEAGSRYNRVPKSKIYSKIRENVEKTYGKKNRDNFDFTRKIENCTIFKGLTRSGSVSIRWSKARSWRNIWSTIVIISSVMSPGVTGQRSGTWKLYSLKSGFWIFKIIHLAARQY